MSIVMQNPNDPKYWEAVKRNTRLRRALQQAKVNCETIRPSMIYERYVSDHMEAVQRAAYDNHLTDWDDYETHLQSCAEYFGLPELTEYDADQIHGFASEAEADAMQSLYGNCPQKLKSAPKMTYIDSRRPQHDQR